ITGFTTGLLVSSSVNLTVPRNTFSEPPSQYSTTSCRAVKPVSMKARRFSRICSRPCQSAIPRLQVASSVKQSKPLPNVLSSISFQKASSHSGGAVFLMVRVVTSFCTCIRLVILLLLVSGDYAFNTQYGLDRTRPQLRQRQ